MKTKSLEDTLLITVLLSTLLFFGCVSAQQREANTFNYGPPPPDNYKQLIMDKAKTNCPNSPFGFFNYSYSMPYKYYNGNDQTSGWAVDVLVAHSVSVGGTSASYHGSEKVVFHYGEVVYWSRFFTCKNE